MTGDDLARSLRRMYRLTAVFGGIGFVSYFWLRGAREAIGFMVGVVGSFANLWLFNWLSRTIEPGERQQKPWQASLFIGRYFGLFLIGYATVKALDVSPLAVVLGLLASTVAILASSILDLIRGLRGTRS